MGIAPATPRAAPPAASGVAYWPAALLCVLSAATVIPVWLGDPFWCLVTGCLLLVVGAVLAGMQRRFAMAGGGRDHHKAIGMTVIERVAIALLYLAILANSWVWATDFARQVWIA